MGVVFVWIWDGDSGCSVGMGMKGVWSLCGCGMKDMLVWCLCGAVGGDMLVWCLCGCRMGVIHWCGVCEVG